MQEVLVFRIEGMVNLERSAALREHTCDLDIPVESAGEPVGRAILTSTCVGFDCIAAASADGGAISSDGIHTNAAGGAVAFTAAGNHAIAGRDGDAAEAVAAGSNHAGAGDGTAGAALGTQACAIGSPVGGDSLAMYLGVGNHKHATASGLNR